MQDIKHTNHPTPLPPCEGQGGKSPLISVITVTRNALDELKKTAESVRQQDYDNIEYIIVDGASTDGTVEWLKKEEVPAATAPCPPEAPSPRGGYGEGVVGAAETACSFITEPDKGIYDAMNKGVRMCHGEWVIFMNAGDTFASPQCLSLIGEALQDETIDIIYGSVNVIKDFGTMSVKPRGLDLLRRKMAFCHQASLSRRRLLTEHPFDLRYRFVADYDFFHWCYTTGKRFHQVQHELANFEAERGASSKHRLKVLRECGRISGCNKTVIGTLEYIGQSLEVGFNKLYRSLTPTSLTNKIRARNYKRINH